MDLDVDLLHPTDPARRFAAMAVLRRDDPVHRVGGAGGPLYLASRAAVAGVLPRTDCFGGGVRAADVHPDIQALNGIAEPRHSRIRRIVNGMIAPHKAGEVRPFLESLCAERLNRIEAVGAYSDGGACPFSESVRPEIIEFFPSALGRNCQIRSGCG